MAIKKQGGEEFTEGESTDTTETPRSATNRKPLVIGATIAGGVLALGAAFGIGISIGHAAPGFPGGDSFASAPLDGGRDGQGDRDGDGRHAKRGQGEFQAPGAEGMQGQTDSDGDFCHPGDGHTHDADGNDVAPEGSAEGFSCQTGPADGTVTPTPSTTTTP